MTVHGAKGLQAPLVILPDTTALPPDEGGLLLGRRSGTRRAVPIWSPRKEMRCAAAIAAARRGRRAADGGAQPAALRRADPRRGPAAGVRLAGRAAPAGRMLVQPGPRGFAAAGAPRLRRLRSTRGKASVLRHAAAAGAWPSGSPSRPQGAGGSSASPLPAWAGRGARTGRASAAAGRAGPARCRWRPAGRTAWHSAPCRRPPRRWPSGTRRPSGSAAASWCTALLQHLPALPEADRRAAALRLSGPARPRAGRRRGSGDRQGGAGDPGAPGAGAAVRAGQPRRGAADRAWSAATVVGGLVDRLAVLADRVLIADFKTNRRPPADRGRHAGAVSAPAGRLSRGAARDLPGPAGALRAGLDPGGAGHACCRTACSTSMPPPGLPNHARHAA